VLEVGTKCEIDVQNLQMFIESTDEVENDTGSQFSEKDYLIHSYEISINFESQMYY
jgi:hypothetical protein